MLTIILTFFAFAFIHSITTAIWFKQTCRNILGDIFMRAYYRAFYTILSLVTVAIAFSLIARMPDRELWIAPTWLSWVMQGIRIAALVLGALAFKHLDGMEFLGVKQVWRYIIYRKVAGNIDGLTQEGLITEGVYGIVRHPLYLAGIIIFTMNPHITLNGLLITVLANVYFLFGMIVEERRFVEMFGEEYRTYMKRVPMMIPRLFSTDGTEKSRKNKS